MNERDDEFVVRLHRELDALLKKEKRLRRTRKIQNRTMDVHIKNIDCPPVPLTHPFFQTI
jgi:hypothetical protein